MIPALSVPLRAPQLNGDCRNASQLPAHTIFIVQGASGLPANNAVVTAGGFTATTNSSGMAVIPAGNFTAFSLTLANRQLQGTLANHEPTLICYSDSYYRVVWLTVTDGQSAQQAQTAS